MRGRTEGGDGQGLSEGYKTPFDNYEVRSFVTGEKPTHQTKKPKTLQNISKQTALKQMDLKTYFAMAILIVFPVFA